MPTTASLLRGSYTYELKCTDGSGTTATSAPSARSSPGAELCIGDRGTALEVHTAGAGSTTDKTERDIVDRRPSLNYTLRRRLLAPPPTRPHQLRAGRSSLRHGVRGQLHDR